MIIHDAFGLTKDIERITDRMAANGYLALTPRLYARGNKIRCVVSTLRAMAAGHGVAVDDIVAAREFLANDVRCTGKVGSIGFCMGGGFCLVLAPRGVFDATAPNYGNWPKDVESLSRSCPTVASYGEKDPLLKGAAPKLRKILTEAGVPHDVKEYSGVGHSFMNDFGTPGPLQFIESGVGFAYSEPEADDAWRRIFAFFETHLA